MNIGTVIHFLEQFRHRRYLLSLEHPSISNILSWAFFCYLGVAVLAALLVPDKEVVCLFVFYLGYYPILKSKIEELSHRWLQWGCKLLLFNGAILLAYYLMLHVFGLAAVADEFSTYTTGFLAVLLAVANVTNVVYDIALTRVVSMYIHWFRPKFLRRF